MSGEPREAPVLGYWAVRGRGAATRLTLHYGKKPFTEARLAKVFDPVARSVVEDPWPEAATALRQQTGHPAPNLPYLRFPASAVLVVQSGAVLRLAGRLGGGDNALATGDGDALAGARIDEAIGHLEELRSEWIGLVYSPEERFQAIEASFGHTTIPYYFALFEALARRSADTHAASGGQGATFLATVGAPSVADMELWELMDCAGTLLRHRPAVAAAFAATLDPPPPAGSSLLAVAYPHLHAIRRSITESPQVQEYLISLQSTPLNGPSAFFGARALPSDRDA